MGLLEADAIEDLLHSSSISKGIERTMERMINELEMDSMYVIRYEEDARQLEVVFDWESGEVERAIDFESYIHLIEEWYHFDEEDMYVARATMVLPAAERTLYKECGYEAVVEYQMTNHGNIIGYIVLGWNHIKSLSEEDTKSLHVLLKLMNEVLIRQFYKEVMGESDWRLFKLASSMTKTMVFMVDDEYKIQFMNNYAKEACPHIKNGDNCYKVLKGEENICKDCVIGQQQVDHRTVMGKKVIFALQQIYKDLIAVEIRRDTFYNLFREQLDNKYSYSMHFVLKWLSKVHLDDKQKFLECFDINFLQDAYENGVTKKEIDFRYRTHEGSYHCMNGQLLFEQNSNKEVVVYILFQDVEQVRSTQIEEDRHLRNSLMAARSAAELQGQVLANISHEIRTPMSGIISMCSVARQVYGDKERLLECLSNIDDYADHMMQVMDSLLETVKVDQESITILKQPFRLENFLNQIDIDVRETIEKKNVQFDMESQCQYQQLIGDSVRLRQAMTALIKNAISYTPISGQIRLLTRQIAVDGKRVFLRFIIEDTGNGLNEKMKESIFGFSHNADNGVIDEQYFSLSLASHIIRLMGGEIGVDVTGNGTQLYFTIPFDLQEAEKNKPVKKKTNLQAGNFTGKRILIAEDSEMAQDALRAVLEVVGFEVDAAENGKKAVIQFISQPAFTYDAILMDVHMPYMDGREATRCIRISGKEDGETIPIIGLMANTYDEDIEESLKAGMQKHLPKPIDVDTLYKVLKKLIPVDEE